MGILTREIAPRWKRLAHQPPVHADKRDKPFSWCKQANGSNLSIRFIFFFFKHRLQMVILRMARFRRVGLHNPSTI